MFWWNFHNRMCIGYNVVALMAEINSFWLHSRKLLHMLKFDFTDTFYRAVCMINLVTFFFCRGWSLMKITVGMYYNKDLVPPTYYYCLCASMFVINSICPVLFWRLFKNDVLRNILGKYKKREKGMANGDKNMNIKHS